MPTALETGLNFGGQALGLIAGLRGNRNAVNAGVQGINDASGTIQRGGDRLQRLYDANYATQQRRIAPYAASGAQNLDALNAGLQPGGGLADPFKFTQQDQLGDPGYQFTLAEGNKAIEAARRAMGTRFSGGAVKQAVGYNTGMANTHFQQVYDRNEGTFRQNQTDRYSRLKAMADQGLQATDTAINSDQNYATESGNTQLETTRQLADLQLQKADAEAAGDLGKAERITGTINSVLGFVNKSGTAKALQKIVTGGGSTAAAVGGGTALSGIVGSGGLGVAGTSAAPAIGAANAALGATAPTLAAGGTVAGGAGLTGYAGGGLITSHGAMIGMLTNPVTIAAAAAIIGAIAWKKSQVHPTANKFVQGYQKPFEGHLKRVVDGFDSAYATGQLDRATAQQLRDETAAFIQGFDQDINSFRTKGKKEREVADNAKREMTKNFGANWEAILSKMDKEIAGLPS